MRRFWLFSLLLTTYCTILITLLIAAAQALPASPGLVVFGRAQNGWRGGAQDWQNLYEIDLHTGIICLFHTFGSQPDWPVAWSPEYTHVAVETLGDIYVVGVEGDMDFIENARSPSWSPSQQLIYEDWSAGRLRYADNERVIAQSINGLHHFPAWSPDATQIAYVCNDYLCITDSATQQTRQLTVQPNDPYNDFYDLAWSPDGNFLVVRRGGGTGADSSLIVDISTGEIVRSTMGVAAFSPDMRYFAYFTGDYTGIRLVLEHDGVVEREIPTVTGQLAWSSDSRLLTWGDWVNVYLLEAATGSIRLVCQNCFYPSWRN